MCARSLWANPFPVKTFGRQGAIEKFKLMLDASQDLQQQLHQLSGEVLLCHCSRSEPCQGDFLIRAWEDKFLAEVSLDANEGAAQAEELFGAAALRQQVEELESVGRRTRARTQGSGLERKRKSSVSRQRPGRKRTARRGWVVFTRTLAH